MINRESQPGGKSWGMPEQTVEAPHVVSWAKLIGKVIIISHIRDWRFGPGTVEDSKL